AASEATLAVPRRTVAMGNAIRHIEAPPDATERVAELLQITLAVAELRRNKPGGRALLVGRRSIARAWTTERRFRGKSWHVHSITSYGISAFTGHSTATA